jgi:hypothetical protein
MQTFLTLFKTQEDLNPDTFVTNLDSFIKENPGGNCIQKLLNTTISFEDVRDEIFSEEGLIYKQLKKFSPEQRDKMIDYIKRYCSYAQEIYYKAINKHKIIDIYTELMKIISKLRFNMDAKNVDMKSLKNLQNNWENFKEYSFLLIKKYSIVADIYTLCRSFKYLNSQENPIMNLVYFGNAHTNNVVHFLTKITDLYYKVEIKSVPEYYDVHRNLNRCIEIKNDIDLDKILNDAREIRNIILQPRKEPSPVMIQPSPVMIEHKQEEICLCKNATTKQRCTYKAKPSSVYCGVHRRCKSSPRQRKKEPSPPPIQPKKQHSPPIKEISPSRQPPVRIQKKQEEICLCKNATTKQRCTYKAKPSSVYCGVHKHCKP